MGDLEASILILKDYNILIYLLKGIIFTLILSVVAVSFGVVFGSILALVRNYCTSMITKPLKWFAIAYIEIFRNTPLMLWIAFFVALPFPEFLARKMFGLTSVEVKMLFKAAAALILFSSSVIAEIVRGGLNSVPNGQFEAGRSQGFHTVQIMVYIALPQAYRNIIPTLISQIITTIKDTSYLANIAAIELMSKIKTLLNSAYLYNGTGKINLSDVVVLFGFAAIMYFIINFSLSSVVRYIQKRRALKARMTPIL